MIGRLLCWVGRHDMSPWRRVIGDAIEVRKCQRHYCPKKEWR